MADLRITQLSTATPLSTSVMVGVVNSTTSQFTVADLRTAINGAATSSGYIFQATGGVGTWKSPIKYVSIQAFDSGSPLTSGPVGYLHIPPDLAGYNLTYVQGTHYASAASAGRTDFKIHNVTDNSSMLTSGYNIDSGILNSTASASQGLIDVATDDVAAGDLLRLDVTAVPSASQPKGLQITLGFSLP